MKVTQYNAHGARFVIIADESRTVTLQRNEYESVMSCLLRHSAERDVAAQRAIRDSDYYLAAYHLYGEEDAQLEETT